jgi:lysophospholipase L1-like esterase
MKRYRVLAFRIVAVAVVAALLVVPAAAFGAKPPVAYTALGDSIAVGVGGTGSVGYVDLLADHLGATADKTMCVSGMTSGDLLALVSNPANAGAIAQADIITVSIGGNDYLQPVLFFISTQDPFVWNALSPQEKLALIGASGVPLQLAQAAQQFAVNWGYTIGTINTLNDHADVYVSTLYNPFKPGDGLYEAVDPLIQQMNAVFLAGAPYADYKVVDVYTAFAQYGNPKKPAVWGLASIYALHPTDRGYKMIYNLHKDAMDTE